MLEQMKHRLVARVCEYPDREQDAEEQDVHRQQVARDEAARAEQEPYRGFIGALPIYAPRMMAATTIVATAQRM